MAYTFTSKQAETITRFIATTQAEQTIRVVKTDLTLAPMAAGVISRMAGIEVADIGVKALHVLALTSGGRLFSDGYRLWTAHAESVRKAKIEANKATATANKLKAAQEHAKAMIEAADMLMAQVNAEYGDDDDEAGKPGKASKASKAK